MAVAAPRVGPALPSPFDWPLDAPLVVTAQATPFEWADAAILPAKPVAAVTATAAGGTAATRPVQLIPYGCTKRLHISMFPLLDDGSPTPAPAPAPDTPAPPTPAQARNKTVRK